MEAVYVTVTVEDDYGIFFKETVTLPREQLIVPGTQTAGLKTVAEALLKSAEASS